MQGTVTIQIPNPVAPNEIHSWLLTRGWTAIGSSMYTHYSRETYELTWDQAVAFESYLLMSIGGS